MNEKFATKSPTVRGFYKLKCWPNISNNKTKKVIACEPTSWDVCTPVTRDQLHSFTKSLSHWQIPQQFNKSWRFLLTGKSQNFSLFNKARSWKLSTGTRIKLRSGYFHSSFFRHLDLRIGITVNSLRIWQLLSLGRETYSKLYTKMKYRILVYIPI